MYATTKCFPRQRRSPFGDLDLTALVQSATDQGGAALQDASGSLVQQLPDSVQGAAQGAIDAGIAAGSKALPPLVTKAVQGAVSGEIGKIMGGSSAPPSPAQSSAILTAVVSNPQLLAAFQGQVAQAVALVSKIPGAAAVLQSYGALNAYKKWAADLVFIQARPELKTTPWYSTWIAKGMTPSSIDPLSTISNTATRENTRLSLCKTYNYAIGPQSLAAATVARALTVSPTNTIHTTFTKVPVKLPASTGIPTWAYVVGGIAILGVGTIAYMKA